MQLTNYFCNHFLEPKRHRSRQQFFTSHIPFEVATGLTSHIAFIVPDAKQRKTARWSLTSVELSLTLVGNERIFHWHMSEQVRDIATRFARRYWDVPSHFTNFWSESESQPSGTDSTDGSCSVGEFDWRQRAPHGVRGNGTALCTVMHWADNVA